jgi:hypothetical protein
MVAKSIENIFVTNTADNGVARRIKTSSSGQNANAILRVLTRESNDQTQVPYEKR